MADTKANKSNHPNVLFIAIDDLCGCPDAMNGETSVHTPNMNALAQKGRVFHQCTLCSACLQSFSCKCDDRVGSIDIGRVSQ